ncbi:hypothetical protein GOODEAATRI_008751 [Goodea atripinnis]|uniref:Interleukin-1 receptor-associated kinase 1-binding protein 1 n=1 Tax=Goodea atripinnis TaxID=208336 RepID=A0ABV0NJN0_9TELE
MNTPVRLYAALPAAETGGKDKQQGLEVTALQRESLGKPVREVQVTGVAEVSCPADRASVRVSVTSTKESVNEIVVTFSEFQKMEQMCRILLEKLDSSVHVGAPQFFHSAASLSQLRCLKLAVENAQQKASKISQLLGESLGSPLLVREEETKEWRNEEEAAGREHSSTALLPLHPHIPTATASSQVSVSFSFRDKSKKKL